MSHDQHDDGERWQFPTHGDAGAAVVVTTGPAPNASAATDAEALQRGSELLSAGQAEQAKLAFEQALAADPSSVEAHLGLARSYYALGEYARAVNEFEAVLRYDNLPRDLQSQAETYDRVAAGYVTPAGWAPFFYGETGVGELPAEQHEIDGHLRRRRQLRHVPADPRRRWLEQGSDRAPFVQWHAGLPLPLVRRQRPSQRLRPALELQPQPARGRRQPAVRHARPGELPGRRRVPQRLGRVRRATISASVRTIASRSAARSASAATRAGRCASARATSPS